MKLRPLLILVLLSLAAIPLMGEDSCSEESPTVTKQGDGGGGGGSSDSNGAPVANVGDTLSLKGTSYKVTKVNTASSVGDQYTGAEANGKFVVIDLTLTNEESEPATILEDNLSLVTKDGNSYSTSDDAILAFPDQTFLLEEIQPGLSESGKLVYDVPPNKLKGARLQVSDLFSDSTGEINLGL
jgi:hypothetical protein